MINCNGCKHWAILHETPHRGICQLATTGVRFNMLHPTSLIAAEADAKGSGARLNTYANFGCVQGAAT